MNNLIRGEFYKLRKSKYFICMIVLSLILGFFLMCQWDTDEGRLRDIHQELMNGIYAIEYSFQYIMITSFMFAMIAGEFIAKDFKNSNINKSLIYGYSRTKVVLSKLLVFAIYCLFLELIYTLILVIYVSYNHEFCEVLNLTTFLYFIRLIIIGVMSILAVICILAMVAIITKSNIYTFISPIFLLITFQIVYSNLGTTLSNVFSYMPNIAGSRAIGMFSSNHEITKSIISSIMTLIITIGGSLLYTKHEDVKG